MGRIGSGDKNQNVENASENAFRLSSEALEAFNEDQSKMVDVVNSTDKGRTEGKLSHME